MSKSLSLLLLAGVSVAAFHGFTQQSNAQVKNVPIQRTSATSGSQMYVTYCSVCHGADGKGNGPAAPALKVPPTDLTTLSQKNGGTFPADHVISVLQFGVENPAHGTPSMPIWSDLLKTLKPGTQDDMEVRLRIRNLTEYLKQMQK